MNYLVYAISSLNLYFGVWFLLNAAGVIQTSKYSQIANTCFAVILIVAAAMAVYCLVSKARNSLALFIDCGPWMITVLLIIASFAFGNTK